MDLRQHSLGNEGVRFLGFLALHEHAFLLEHDGYGAEEYLGVEGEAYVVDVVDVECEALVPRERVSAVCGGVAGDAGLDEKLLALVSLVELGFAL